MRVQPTSANSSASMAMVDSGTSFLHLPPPMHDVFREVALTAAELAGLSVDTAATDGSVCFLGATLEEAVAGLPPLVFKFSGGGNVTGRWVT